MQQMCIGFIGGGNMAGALISGLIRAGHPATQLSVFDVQAARMTELQQQYGICPVSNMTDLTKASDVLVLAVKPQQIRQLALDIAAYIPEDCTTISIAAGVSTDSLQESLGADVNLVRVMPNTPCLVNKGMSVLFTCAPEMHRNRAEYILAATGKTAWVEDEQMLHAVTAVSGSGPAYFFLLTELMQASAKALGLPEDLSKMIAVQTALGSGYMLAESGKTAEDLRLQVSSPGGTTQAALEQMFESNLPNAVRAAIVAAAKRSKELS